MSKENQGKIILKFLKKVVERVEKETEIKEWKCLEFDGKYYIKNKSLVPIDIVVLEKKPKEIIIFIYTFDLTLEKSIDKSIKAELLKTAKELKIYEWEIDYKDIEFTPDSK